MGETRGRARTSASAWIDRTARFLYVHPRRVGRREQLCLRAADGTELGWKDLASGRVMVRCRSDDAALAHAVLEVAGPPDRPLPAHELPAVALDVPAGTLLAHLQLRSAAVLLGREWCDAGSHRLYGTFTYPGRSTIPLGVANLTEGTFDARRDRVSSLDAETMALLLRVLVERRPTQYYP